MEKDKKSIIIVEKEMGLTHKEFYHKISRLLENTTYLQIDNKIKFEIEGKKIDIILGKEDIRILSVSARLPMTRVKIVFYGFEQIGVDKFVRRFNLRFLKGGG